MREVAEYEPGGFAVVYEVWEKRREEDMDGFLAGESVGWRSGGGGGGCWWKGMCVCTYLSGLGSLFGL